MLHDERDDLRGSKGVGCGIVAGVAVWALIIFLLMMARGCGAAATAADYAALGAEWPHTHSGLGPVVNAWQPQTPQIGYGFAALVDRTSDGGAPPWTVLTVGAQINASNAAGINQVVFGIATEARAKKGSTSFLIGLEATPINEEPTNEARKIAFFATFKNRMDFEYSDATRPAANVNSQALRIESFPGTGFERGIVLAPYSLHASTKVARPALIDLSEVSEAEVEAMDLIKFPDGYSLVYYGHGQIGMRSNQ